MNRWTLSGCLAGGLLLSFLILPNNVSAASDPVLTGSPVTITSPCPEPSACPMPAPTVVLPAENLQYAYGTDIVIAGLSWNQTKVDVYIDGTYNGRADLRTDPSEVGNFVYRPYLPLMPGSHTLYTVARNLSERERSPQSATIRFEVLTAASRPLPPATSETETPDEPEETESVPEQESATSTQESANAILDWFFNEESATATATGTEATTAATRRLSTRGIISLILAAAVLIFFYRLYRSRQQLHEATENDSDKPVPPDDWSPPPT